MALRKTEDFQSMFYVLEEAPTNPGGKSDLTAFYGGMHKILMEKARHTKNLPTNANIRGMCFRLSYKWLVSMWNKTAWKGLETNMVTTFDKQMDYLKQADTLAGKAYDEWFSAANVLSKKTLATWGEKHNHGCAEPIDCKASLAGSAAIADGSEVAAIVGFFGTKTDGSVWGHATAYCNRVNQATFFDINFGTFNFDGSDSRSKQMEDFIRSKYESATETIANFVLYKIS